MLELDKIHCGDNCDLLGQLPRECIDLVVTSQPIADSEPVACANGEEATEKPEAPRAPVASAIVLAVAEFWHTDNKTAARWITERAAEIESLQ